MTNQFARLIRLCRSLIASVSIALLFFALAPASLFRRGSIVLAILVGFATGLPAVADEAKTYESKFYSVSSNLTAEEMSGVLRRLDCLIPEYMQRFPALRGAISHKFNVQVFRGLDAMHGAGAPKEVTYSTYLPWTHKSYILVGEDFQAAMIDMQFDCFIQYCNEAIDNDGKLLPRWLLIGIGRHFRWARFTGDGYVCGLFPWRVVEDTQKGIIDGRFPNANEVLNRPRDDENSVDGYFATEAWWISYYLDHGDKGLHHEAFSKYLHDVARGISHKEAWEKSFAGLDIDAAWRRWAQNQTLENIHEEYAWTLSQTLAAYAGRAALEGQKFTDLGALTKSIMSGELKMPDTDRLPKDLAPWINSWTGQVGKDTGFSIEYHGETVQVVALLTNKTRIVATFDPGRKGARTYTEIEGPGRAKMPGTPDNPAAAGSNTIVLKSAKFGTKGQWVDVTEKCQSMIVGDMMIAPARLTEVFGISPAGGDANWLQLELVVNGAKVRMLLSDNQRLAPLRLTTQLPSEINE